MVVIGGDFYKGSSKKLRKVNLPAGNIFSFWLEAAYTKFIVVAESTPNFRRAIVANEIGRTFSPCN